MGYWFILCTVHTSTTKLYHHNSGNVVRPNIPTAVSQKTQVSWDAALCQRWRLMPSFNMTEQLTYRHSVTTPTTWILSDMDNQTTNLSAFQQPLTCPMPLAQQYTMAESNCLVAHSRKPIIFNMQTVHWKPWYKQSVCSYCGTNNTNTSAWIQPQNDFTLQSVALCAQMYIHKLQHHCNKQRWSARFKVLTVALLSIQIIHAVMSAAKRAVPNVLKVCSSFIFMVKPSKNPPDEGTQSYEASGGACPTTHSHISEDLQLQNLSIWK